MLKALEEDIRFAEGLSPVAVEVDANGHAKRAQGCRRAERRRRSRRRLPARTILVAAGTQPNTVLAREDATHAFIDGKYFRALDEEGNPVDARARRQARRGARADVSRTPTAAACRSSATCIPPSPATS